MKIAFLSFLITISNCIAFGQAPPELLMFSATECYETEEKERLRVTTQKWLNDSTVMIGVKLHANCCDADYRGVTTQGDTLTLLFGSRFETDSEGNVTEIEHCLCNCNFEFQYLITNITSDYNLRMRHAGYKQNTKLIAKVKRD